MYACWKGKPSQFTFSEGEDLFSEHIANPTEKKLVVIQRKALERQVTGSAIFYLFVLKVMSFKLNVFILSIIFDNQQLNICLLQLSDLKIGGEW